jgi:hypothetical protein
VYFPPSPHYIVARVDDGSGNAEAGAVAMFMVNDKGDKSRPQHISNNFKIEFLKTAEDETIATLFIRNPK